MKNPRGLPETLDGRSGFLLAIMRKEESPAARDPERFFRASVGTAPDIHLSFFGLELVGTECAPTAVVQDPAADLRILLHGEIHGAVGGDGAETVLAEYRARGAPGVGRLDGSFAVVVADRQAGAVRVITDRWNTRRVFHSSVDGVDWLSTARTLGRHPLPGAGLDPAGIAHFLVNQLPYNGRTLHRGLEVLDRASVHSVGREGLRSRRYWSFELTNEHAGRSSRELRDGFHERLLHAVYRRTEGAPAWLALTGGWDSRSILGAAHEGGVSDLRCVSYGEAGGGPRTDGAVAERVAAELGFAHRFVPGFTLDLLDAFDANRRAGGTVQLVIEADAWEGVGALVADGGNPPPLLFGDQGVGCRPHPFLRSPPDALSSMKICGMRAVPWLRRLMPEGSYARMRDGLESDRSRVLARVPAGMALQDIRYWLYMDQYLSRLVAYREFFAGRWSRPRYPLIDHALMDFVAGLPSHLRTDKRILKDTATERFPAVFAREGASGGAPSPGPWLGSRLRQEAGRIRRRLTERPSPLDEILPPGVLLGILDGVLEGRWRRRLALRSKVRSRVRNSRLAARVGPALTPLSLPTTSPERFLACGLHLRDLLRHEGRREMAP